MASSPHQPVFEDLVLFSLGEKGISTHAHKKTLKMKEMLLLGQWWNFGPWDPFRKSLYWSVGTMKTNIRGMIIPLSNSFKSVHGPIWSPLIWSPLHDAVDYFCRMTILASKRPLTVLVGIKPYYPNIYIYNMVWLKLSKKNINE